LAKFVLAVQLLVDWFLSFLSFLFPDTVLILIRLHLIWLKYHACLYAYPASSTGLLTVQLSFGFLRVPPMVRRDFPSILFPEATLGRTSSMLRRLYCPLCVVYFYKEL